MVIYGEKEVETRKSMLVDAILMAVIAPGYRQTEAM